MTDRRDIFLDILEQVRAKYDFVVAGYVAIHRVHANCGRARKLGDA